MSIHNIAGSEILSRHRMMPGYAAVRVGAARPWQWRWRHTAIIFSLVVAGLSYAGWQGLLP